MYSGLQENFLLYLHSFCKLESIILQFFITFSRYSVIIYHSFKYGKKKEVAQAFLMLQDVLEEKLRNVLDKEDTSNIFISQLKVANDENPDLLSWICSKYNPFWESVETTRGYSPTTNQSCFALYYSSLIIFYAVALASGKRDAYVCLN